LHVGVQTRFTTWLQHTVLNIGLSLDMIFCCSV
jgi:hypothetical protein